MNKDIILKEKNKKEILSNKILIKGIFILVIAVILCITQNINVFATDDPLTAVGMIILGFGIVQIGMSLKSHDPTQRANGIMTLAGGVVITFAKEILNLITGG